MSDRGHRTHKDPQSPGAETQGERPMESEGARPTRAASNDVRLPIDRGSDESEVAADQRMADLLSSETSNAHIRHELQQEETEEASDLLGRLNALDFVGTVVGETTDMPERLGDYKITGLLGRGGMGTVYLAYQEQLDREVALKVLSSSWSADPTMRQRFRAEARATASLHHQHIVPIYDYGEAQGCLFFAMERVDGYSLDRHIAAARRLKKEPMEPLDAARRFAGVADALGLAHRRRILHRDVKPGNVLVSSDGTLALTDFGLAKALDQASVHLTSKSGGFLGTLHYSSPEQALGGELTPASDLYSLGVTIFEAVSGKLPIEGKTTEAVLQSILHGTPRRLRDVMHRPPRDLAAVLDKLLSREPADRYQDGEMLARDLMRIADGEPVHIRRQPIALRLYRRARKNPVLSGAVIAATVLLLVTFALLFILKKENEAGRISRHQNQLYEVVNSVRAEMGAPWGRPPMLSSLVGGGVAGTLWVSPEVLRGLRAAGELMPDDGLVERMQQAYEEDAAPAASVFLAEGRGYEALVDLNRAILDAQQARSIDRLAAELQLYNLYLARAAANLTMAVARPDDARRDLDLASFLRPGAVFPKALATLLDVVESQDVATTLARIEERLQQAGEERRVAVGRLLWVLAGVRPVADANLMKFDLTQRDRSLVYEAAQRYVEEPPPGTGAPGVSTGLAEELQELAQAALGLAGEPAKLRAATTYITKFVHAVAHPDSPLQGWCGVAQLLERPRSPAPLRDSRGGEMTPRLELAAWDALLSLSPPRSVLEMLLVSRFEEMRSRNAGLDGLVRTAALMHVGARTAQAVELVNQWVAEFPDDPEAWFARLALAIDVGDKASVLDAAMLAVQNSADRALALHEVIARLERAAVGAAGGVADELQALADQFREVPP